MAGCALTAFRSSPQDLVALRRGSLIARCVFGCGHSILPRALKTYSFVLRTLKLEKSRTKSSATPPRMLWRGTRSCLCLHTAAIGPSLATTTGALGRLLKVP